VSEETGRISIALEGRIDQGIDGKELRARLRSLLATQRSAPSQGVGHSLLN
jgi:hypothetical protein